MSSQLDEVALVPLKRLFREVNEPSQGDETLLSASQEHGVVARSRLAYEVWNPGEDTSLYKRAEVGDFVISLRSFQGGLELTHEPGILSPAYTVLRPAGRVFSRYFRWFFKSKPFIASIDARTSGIRQGKTVRWQSISGLAVRLPSMDEQRRIADFLDRECERIATLRGQVGRLEHALNETWFESVEGAFVGGATKRLRYWGARVQLGPFGSALKADEYVAGGVPLINPVHIHWRGLEPDPDTSILEARANELAQWRMKPGDVVVARRGELGRAAVLQPDEEGYFCGTGSAIVRLDPSLDPQYLVLALLTRAAREHLELAAVGSTMKNLDTDALLDLPVVERSRDQQAIVVHGLMEGRATLEVAVGRTAALVERLGEYRDALTTEAVTGQLDVSRLSDAQLDESARAAIEGDRPEVLST